MNKIHPNSHTTTVADFDMFSIPRTQEMIEKNIVTEHRPISILSPNSLIEFSVTSAHDEFIQLRETMLYLKLRIDIKKTAGGNVDVNDWKKIQPVNNLLHSLFKTVDLEIEGKSITQSPQTYAYKAFFETMLGYTEEAKTGFLSSVYWYPDEEKKDAVDEDESKKIRPDPITNDGQGKYIELMGKLHLDLAFQPIALPGGLKLKFTLVPNQKEFYLWKSDSSIKTEVKFDSCALYLTRSKLIPSASNALNMALIKGTAKYPITRGHVKSFTITSGALDASLDNAILGQIPRRMFLALVDSRAFNNDETFNPYKFQHFDLNYLTANVDGTQYPSIAFTPDFGKNLYVREFLSIYETLNQMTSDTSLALNREEYKKGNVLFGFNFAPDPTDDCNKTGYVNLIKNGSIRFILKFGTALAQNINVLIYCEYDNLIQIDSTRQAICDYI